MLAPMRVALTALLLLVCSMLARGQDAPTAPPPPPADPLAWLAAPGRVPIAGSPRVGWRVVQTSRAGPQQLVTSWAIVGETADAWRVEHVSPVLQSLAASDPALDKAIMGLVVRKSDGVVLEAVVGAPGQAGRQIRIREPEAPPAPAAETSEEQLTVPGGTFRARKQAVAHTTTWTGLEGAVREVVLKVEGPAPYELARPPERLELGGRELLRISWSNKSSQDLVEDPVVAGFFPAGGPGRGLWALRGEGFEIAISEVGTNATPRLKWE